MLPLAGHAQNQPAKTSAEQEQANQTIRVTTELIEIRAVVTDKAGKAIDGLKLTDFELLEEKKPQQISFFNFTRIAGRNTGTSSQPATILAERQAPPARSVILFADTLHLSASNLLFLKQSLRQFIKGSLTDQDLAGLVTSYGSLGVGEQLTRDRRLLSYAVERLNVGPQERVSAFTPYLASLVERNDQAALTEAINILVREEALQPTPRNMAEAMARARARMVLLNAEARSRNTLYTLRSVIERLARLPGQRLLVFFSDGFTTLDASGTPDLSLLQAITSRATRSGVVIYSIDGKGLQPPPGMSAEFSGPVNMQFASANESEQENGMASLALDTGGKFMANTNDLAAAATQALAENESYYTLAYYPAEETKPDRFRKLTVRVIGHPEYKVRAQKGYIPAALGKKEQPKAAQTPDQRLSQQMLEPLAATEIGVAANANDIETNGDTATASLQVYIDGNTLTIQNETTKPAFEAKVAVMVFDSSGKLAYSGADTISGLVKPDRLTQMRANGLTYFKRLALKPGFYQIRIGIQEPLNERVGTANTIVEIPDLKKKRMTLSSLMIADASPELTGQPADPQQKYSASAKIRQGIRFYQPKQRFVYYTQLYANAPQVSQPEQFDQLEMQTEVWHEGKLRITGEWLPVKDRVIARDNKGVFIGAQILLNNFQPGIYELRFSVRQRGKKQTIQRIAVFGVE